MAIVEFDRKQGYSVVEFNFVMCLTGPGNSQKNRKRFADEQFTAKVFRGMSILCGFTLNRLYTESNLPLGWYIFQVNFYDKPD